ncbi:hypothetical protein [Bradyrhizobium sp. 2TAF24]|uniref:hypothetical protein n=1 Tax=Bradyrhizobium sp. 2TAF24 TaxID=3233011 RepID=UPI003F8DB5A9
MFASDLRKLLKWVTIIAFFLVAPAAALLLADWIVQSIGGDNQNNDMVRDFHTQLPSILLAFYWGGIGAIVAYIYARTHNNAASEPLINQMAKLLFGGLMGVAGSFFFEIGRAYQDLLSRHSDRHDHHKRYFIWLAYDHRVSGRAIGPIYCSRCREPDFT